jgi:hypothetical protein
MAATSIRVFGVYLVALGAFLFLTPNTLLTVFEVASTNEPWIRVLGAVVGVLGAYYIDAARHQATSFFRATLWGRATILVLFAILVLVRLAPPILILFGAIDAAGSLWTLVALRTTQGAA